MSRSRQLRVRAGWGLVLSGLLAVGCAGMPLLPGSDAKSSYLEDQAEQHVYRKPLAEVWTQARELLIRQGYRWIDDAAPEGETDWKYQDEQRARYRVEASSLKDGSCRFVFRRELQRKQGKTAWMNGKLERDGGQEWSLMKVADPEAAAVVQKKADSHYD